MTDTIPTDHRPLGYWVEAVGHSLARSLELPLSAVGKVLKTALREPYWRDKARNVN